MELNCLFFIWMSSLQNDVATRGWYDDDPHCTVAAVAADEGVGTQLTRPHSPLQRSRYIKKTNFKPSFWARVLKDFGTLGFVRKTWIYWARVVGLLKSGVYSETTWIYSELVPLDFWNLEIVLKTWIYWALFLWLLKPGVCSENLDLLSSCPWAFETWGLIWKLETTELVL